MAGYKVQKLAKMLQAAFPSRNGLEVTWSTDNIHCAKGAWRKKSMDVWSWQAFGTYTETGGTAFHFGSYATVTELIKHKGLCRLGTDEIEGTNDPAEIGK